MSAPLLLSCPGCGRRLKWEHTDVFGGGDPTAHLPLESYDAAECKCNYEIVRYGGTLAERERGEPEPSIQEIA